MRISDWSSDVCSADLHVLIPLGVLRNGVVEGQNRRASGHGARLGIHLLHDGIRQAKRCAGGGAAFGRSEERRVGKACGSTCRSRWSPYHYKQNKQLQTTVADPYTTKMKRNKTQ